MLPWALLFLSAELFAAAAGGEAVSFLFVASLEGAAILVAAASVALTASPGASVGAARGASTRPMLCTEGGARGGTAGGALGGGAGLASALLPPPLLAERARAGAGGAALLLLLLLLLLPPPWAELLRRMYDCTKERRMAEVADTFSTLFTAQSSKLRANSCSLPNNFDYNQSIYI